MFKRTSTANSLPFHKTKQVGDEDADVNIIGFSETASRNDNPSGLLNLGSQIIINENYQLGQRASIYAVTYFAIILSTTQEIVGYVISTDEVWHNNSLHDGSGTHYYIDVEFSKLFDVRWEG